MNQFETHVYVTVRVKVIGTNFSNDPQEIADKVTAAVCADPSQWMRPVHGSVNIEGHGSHDIEAAEFSDGIYGVLVDEINPETGLVVVEHQFDETCAPREDKASTQAVVTEVLGVLEGLPDALVGNSKVHFAVMRLKSLLPDAKPLNNVA